MVVLVVLNVYSAKVRKNILKEGVRKGFNHLLDSSLIIKTSGNTIN